METTTAQPKPAMTVEPQKQHQWLQRFVGEWTIQGEVTMEPGKSPEKYNGTESVRTIGGLWILGEWRGAMPDGSPAVWITMLGYDPQKGRFVGTFTGSMMTYLWIYDGELDSDERVLTLNTEGPNMAAEGKMARFQDVVEFVNEDHRVLTSRMLGDDGQWRQVMRADYWRMK